MKKGGRKRSVFRRISLRVLKNKPHNQRIPLSFLWQRYCHIQWSILCILLVVINLGYTDKYLHCDERLPFSVCLHLSKKNRTKFVREWPWRDNKHCIFLFTVPSVVLSDTTRHFFTPKLLTAIFFPDILGSVAGEHLFYCFLPSDSFLDNRIKK